MYFSNSTEKLTKKLNWLHFKPLHKWNSLKRLSIYAFSSTMLKLSISLFLKRIKTVKF